MLIEKYVFIDFKDFCKNTSKRIEKVKVLSFYRH